MKQCNYCHHSNKEGVFFCEDCGRRVDILAPSATLPTKKIDLDLSLDGLAARTTWGTARFETKYRRNLSSARCERVDHCGTREAHRHRAS